MQFRSIRRPPGRVRACQAGRPAVRPLAEPLEPRRLFAGDPGVPELIHNVNATTNALGPDAVVTVGGVGYFAGQGYGGVGRELWRTDGTAAGTYRVKDINPGPAGSDPSRLVAVGGAVYFAADDGARGRELWRTDGTEAGTARVADLNPGTAAGGPANLTAVGDALYFTANAGQGVRLWRVAAAATTAAAAPELVTGVPANASSPPSHLIAYNGDLLFAADQKLYRTNGTGAATPLGGSPVVPANPRSPTLLGGHVYFAADSAGGSQGDLWRTDGTTAGTVRVKMINLGANDYTSLAQLTASGDLLYFLAKEYTTSAPYQLWRSDGTDAGTFAIAANGKFASYTQLTPVGARSVMYPGYTSAAGEEPWITDGTTASSRLLADLSPGPTNGWGGGGFLRVGGTFFFGTNLVYGDTRLWRTDGTTAGTALVRDVDEANAFIQPLGAVGGRLLFTGGYGIGQGDLFASDGTAAGTTRVGSADAGSGSGPRQSISEVGLRPAILPAGNGVGYFTADDGVHGSELWRVNPPGSAVGAELVADLAPGGLGSDPGNLVRADDGTLYFTAHPAGVDAVRWVFRMPPGGVPSHLPGSVMLPAQLTPLGSALYYAAEDPADSFRYLWRYDAATRSNAKVLVAGKPVLNPYGLTQVGPYLYFAAEDTGSHAGSTNHGSELWRTDGTAAGTLMIKDIYPGPTGSNPTGLASGTQRFAAVGSTVYFTADDGTRGRELWRTDGTPAGTTLAAELTAGRTGTEIGEAHAYGGALYLSGPAGLLRFDDKPAGGSVTTALAGVTSAREFTTAGDGSLYFVAADAVTRKLAVYRTAGAPAGFARVDALGGGDPTFAPTALHAAGGQVYVVGPAGPGSGGNRYDLWATDGTPDGTRLVMPLQPRVAVSPLSNYWVVGRSAMSDDGRYLYFPAYTPELGTEPYRLRLPPPRVRSVPVNGGAAQRSMVGRVEVRFDQPVTLDAGAFGVTRRPGTAAEAGPVGFAAATPDGGRTYVLTFTGPGADGGSLADGVYDLAVRAAGVRAAGQSMAADHVVTFHRLFADADGDRDVDGGDSRGFRGALGSELGMPAYNPTFDYDADGDVDGADSRAFRRRLGTEI